MLFWLFYGILSVNPFEKGLEAEKVTESVAPVVTEPIDPTPGPTTMSTQPTARTETHIQTETQTLMESESLIEHDNSMQPQISSENENLILAILFILMLVCAIVGYKWRVNRNPARGEDEIFDGEAQNMARYRDRLNDDANLTIDVLSDEE